MSEWREYMLSDVMDIIGGGTPKTSIPEYWSGSIPWLSVVDFGNENKYVQKTEKYITELGLKSSSTKILRDGQIIISARGTVGELAVIKGNMAFNQSCYGLTAKDSICHNDFLYYLLKCKIVELKRNAHGAVFDTITRTTFDSISAIVPDLPTQTAIAEILSSLDDKIELNNKINQELENLAQTLFKQWFIDFEFPNENGEPYKSSGGKMVESELGEIPKGWRVSSIDDITEKVGMGPFGSNIKVETFVEDGIPIISGQHLKGTLVEDNEYNFITVTHAQKLKNSLVSFGDVVFTHAGNIGQVAYLHSASRYKEYIISQRQFYLRPNNEHASGLFLTLFFKSSIGQYRLLANTSSTGVPSISRPVTYLRSIKVIISSNEIMNKFTDVVMSFYNDITSNFRENKSLSELRDTLLPKLISGELEINELSN